MDLFGKLSETVSNTSAAVGNKAKELSEIAKLKNAIATEERKIKEEYEKIGRAYVKCYRDSEDAMFADSISKIKASEEIIEAKQELLNEVKQVKVCPVCGAAIADNSTFCPKCGGKVE